MTGQDSFVEMNEWRRVLVGSVAYSYGVVDVEHVPDGLPCEVDPAGHVWTWDAWMSIME